MIASVVDMDDRRKLYGQQYISQGIKGPVLNHLQSTTKVVVSRLADPANQQSSGQLLAKVKQTAFGWLLGPNMVSVRTGTQTEKVSGPHAILHL